MCGACYEDYHLVGKNITEIKLDWGTVAKREYDKWRMANWAKMLDRYLGSVVLLVIEFIILMLCLIYYDVTTSAFFQLLAIFIVQFLFINLTFFFTLKLHWSETTYRIKNFIQLRKNWVELPEHKVRYVRPILDDSGVMRSFHFRHETDKGDEEEANRIQEVKKWKDDEYKEAKAYLEHKKKLQAEIKKQTMKRSIETMLRKSFLDI
jgi:hypothetical protein